MRDQLTKLYHAASAPLTATRDALAERLQSVRETTSLLYYRIMEDMEYGQERLKDTVEKEAGEEEQQQEEDIDLTPHKHERALRGACRSFVIPGTPKTDNDSYFDQAKPHIKAVIKNRLKEMGYAKIIMTLWVRWKKPIKQLIELDPEDSKNAQELDDDLTDDNYITVEMPFNSFITKFFEGSDINDLMQRMLAHIKTQAENSKFPESGCLLDKIMRLYINFHGLVLTRGSSYNELPE